MDSDLIFRPIFTLILLIILLLSWWKESAVLHFAVIIAAGFVVTDMLIHEEYMVAGVWTALSIIWMYKLFRFFLTRQQEEIDSLYS